MREILGKIFPVCNFGKSFLVGIFWEEFHLQEILGRISQLVYFGKSFPVGIFCEELLQENSAMNYFCCKIGYSQSGYLSKFFLNWEFWEELILTISSRLGISGKITSENFPGLEILGKITVDASADSNSFRAEKIFPGCDIHLFARIFTPE